MPRATTFKEDMDFAKRLAEAVCDSITADFVLSWVAENFDPGDVYDEYDLIRWVRDNDFARKDEDE